MDLGYTGLLTAALDLGLDYILCGMKGDGAQTPSNEAHIRLYNCIFGAKRN